MTEDRSGELLAAGIRDGVAGIAQGILRAQQREAEREKEQKAFEMLREFAPPSVSDKAIRSGIRGMGAGQVYDVVMAAKREQDAQPLRALQMENATLQNRLAQADLAKIAAARVRQEQDAAALAAIRPSLRGDAITSLPSGDAVERAMQLGLPIPQATKTVRPPNGVDALAEYLVRGGTDPQMLRALGTVAENAKLGPTPSIFEDPVSGERKVIYGPQMQPSGRNPQKAPKPGEEKGVVERQFGPRKLFLDLATQRYFDTDGREVVRPAGSSITADAIAQLAGVDAGGAGAPDVSSMEGEAPGPATAGAAAAKAAPTARKQPVKVSTKEERDALPPGTRYVGPDGNVYTKK